MRGLLTNDNYFQNEQGREIFKVAHIFQYLPFLQSRPIKMRTPILYLESGSIGLMGSACFAAVLTLLQQATNKGSV